MMIVDAQESNHLATFGRKYFAPDMTGGFGKVLHVGAGARIVRNGAVVGRYFSGVSLEPLK